MLNLAQLADGVKLTKTCKIKADETSTTSKTITLVVDFGKSTMQSVFNRAMTAFVIKWQGNNRKNFDRLVDGQTIDVDFGESATMVITEEMAKQAFRNSFLSKTAEQQKTEIAEMTQAMEKKIADAEAAETDETDTKDNKTNTDK